jgi:lipid-binding SYLF domain-containing protein
MNTVRILPLFLILVGTVVGCSSSTSPAANVDERSKIDAAVNKVLPQFYRDVQGSQELARKAQGMLVFPDVYKAGIVVGGEYGKGALRVGGDTAGYYNIASGSVGLQLGAEARTIVFLFMTPQALADFRNSSGWQAGATAGVAVVKQGAEASADTSRINAPILAFVFGNTGLMADVSVEGTKISKLDF